jgi:hypothetical protein
MMSARSQAAWRLGLPLAAHFGLRPGAVEVRWDKTYFPGGYRWGWVVNWADGPTVAQMAATAQELAGEPLAAELDRGLAYERGITPLAFAMQLVAATQAGEDVGAVDDPSRWEQRLETMAFPERPTDPQQERLARLLVAAVGKGGGERDMGRVLALQGLGGLAAGADPDPAVVVPIERARQPHHGERRQ